MRGDQGHQHLREPITPVVAVARDLLEQVMKVQGDGLRTAPTPGSHADLLRLTRPLNLS